MGIWASMFGNKPRVWRSVNDIENAVTLKLAQRGPAAMRGSVQIAAIDDQPFSPAQNLRNHGYNIDYFNDVGSLDAVQKYGIILCDLQGVGSNFNADLQGAHLIREMKRRYPEKYIIAYTGSAKNTVMARLAQQNADAFIKKDADIQNWIEALDAAIAIVGNPVAMWKLFRKRMLDDGMTLIQVAELEDTFVDNFWKGSASIDRGIAERSSNIGINADVRAIIQGFIASLIFKAVMGA